MIERLVKLTVNYWRTAESYYMLLMFLHSHMYVFVCLSMVSIFNHALCIRSPPNLIPILRRYNTFFRKQNYNLYIEFYFIDLRFCTHNQISKHKGFDKHNQNQTEGEALGLLLYILFIQLFLYINKSRSHIFSYFHNNNQNCRDERRSHGHEIKIYREYWIKIKSVKKRITEVWGRWIKRKCPAMWYTTY